MEITKIGRIIYYKSVILQALISLTIWNHRIHQVIIRWYVILKQVTKELINKWVRKMIIILYLLTVMGLGMLEKAQLCS